MKNITITIRASVPAKNESTARILANAQKDHTIPLIPRLTWACDHPTVQFDYACNIRVGKKPRSDYPGQVKLEVWWSSSGQVKLASVVLLVIIPIKNNFKHKTARWAKERSESNKRKSEHCAPIGKVTFWWGQLKTGMHWPNFKIIFLPWTFQTRLHDEIVMSYPWYEHAERVTID